MNYLFGAPSQRRAATPAIVLATPQVSMAVTRTSEAAPVTASTASGAAVHTPPAPSNGSVAAPLASARTFPQSQVVAYGPVESSELRLLHLTVLSGDDARLREMFGTPGQLTRSRKGEGAGASTTART